VLLPFRRLQLTPSDPHAGQQARQIKALSDEDITALRGEGMAWRRRPSLTSRPCPCARTTKQPLTEDQTRQVQLVFDHMSAAAKPLGGEVIAHERTLDQLFATAPADRDSVAGGFNRWSRPAVWLRAAKCAPS
jgi:hypothetical protein